MTFYLLLSVVLLYGCSEFFPGNGGYRVNSVNENTKYSDYQLVQIKGKGQTWIRAEVGKYHVGDTLWIGSGK